MEIAIPELLNYGVHGLIALVLLFGWYERREMRREQYEIIKLLLATHPEAQHLVNPELKRKLKIEKLHGEQNSGSQDTL